MLRASDCVPLVFCSFRAKSNIARAAGLREMGYNFESSRIFGSNTHTHTPAPRSRVDGCVTRTNIDITGVRSEKHRDPLPQPAKLRQLSGEKRPPLKRTNCARRKERAVSAASGVSPLHFSPVKRDASARQIINTG